MTFSKLILKNFLSHGKRYISFFLCNCFSIMILLMFSSLMFNETINHRVDITTIEFITASVIALIVFVFFFMNYAFSSFVKSRNSEMGLFMLLGMNSREVRRLQIFESAIIIFLSLVTGLLLGTLFSRLFFMLMLDILKMNVLNYSFEVGGYIFTSITFLIISTLMVLYNNYLLGKAELIELIKFSRKTEEGVKKKPYLGVLGVVLILAAFILKYVSAARISIVPEVSTKFTAICLIGLYFFITQFIELILDSAEKSAFLYNRYLINIKELKYKINRNKIALYIITMLNSFTLFFFGNSYSSGLTYFSAKNNEGQLLLFISGFLALLFFIASACIIYFKLFTELEDEKKRFNKLSNIGITTKQAKKYLALELMAMFLIPNIVSLIIVFLYTYFDNLNNSLLGQILLNFILVVILFNIFQYVSYLFIKTRFTKAVLID